MAATALINARIFDGKGVSLAGRTVIVEDGLIRGIGAGDPPSHAAIIDLKGRTIMPGMTVGHWHGEFVDIGPPLFSSGRGGVFVGTEEPPALLALAAATSLQTALMSGVTRIVSASCSNDLDGQMQSAMQRGMFDGPHLTACSRHIVTTGDYEDRGHWWKTHDRAYDGVRRVGGNVFADGPDQIAKAVRQEILRGAQIIKIIPTGGHGFEMVPGYRGLSLAEMDMVVRTAHERGARVRAHVTSASAILECLAVGVDIIDHADGMNDACIEAMVKKGTTLVPSMLFAKLVSYGGVGQPRPGRDADAAWDNLKVMLARASAAGVNIVPGDDFGAKGMAHALGVYARELLVYQDDMGIAPEDVLRWATFNGAKLTFDDKTNGSIEEGKDADLLVVNGDPVANLALLLNPEENLDAIMLAGRFIKDRLTGKGASSIEKTGSGTFAPELPKPTTVAAE